MKNREIAHVFREMAAFLQMDEVPFKPQAYERAADSVEQLSEPVEDVFGRDGRKGLEKLPGIGKSVAAKIAEYLEDGRIAAHEELRAKTPVDLMGLIRIEGLGPKGVRALHETLGISSVRDLEEAARTKRIREVPGFGAKSEEKILRAIGFVASDAGRLPLGRVRPFAEELADRLRKLAGVSEVAIAGSLRRWKETIGDLDLLVVAERPEEVAEHFVSLPEVAEVLAHGETKSSVRLTIGIDADLRTLPAESYGAALQYFTGSKEHGVACRKLAIEQGLKLNEYGVFHGDEQVAGATEEGVYDSIGLPWIPPELREDRGEIRAAREGQLPDLVERKDLRGELCLRSRWSDGKSSIAELVEAALTAGHQYVAIADRAGRSTTAGALDEEALERQGREIAKVNRSHRGIRVLRGAAVGIAREGSLELSDHALARLEVVGVEVRGHLGLSRADMTARVCRAIRHPRVALLFQSSTRRHERLDLDQEEVLRTAAEAGIAVEIASGDRSDFGEDQLRVAAEAGVRFVLGSGSSRPDRGGELRYAVARARRGWVERESVVNTRSAARVLRDFSALRKARATTKG